MLKPLPLSAIERVAAAFEAFAANDNANPPPPDTPAEEVLSGDSFCLLDTLPADHFHAVVTVPLHAKKDESQHELGLLREATLMEQSAANNNSKPQRVAPKRSSALFSSKSDNWPTPMEFFQKYDKLYNFTLDVCASNDNHKCARYFTVAENGLEQDWGTEVCWMNPPYGRPIINWMKKAYEASLAGATVVCLVPSRTDTKWWHEYAMRGDIKFVRGRLHFGSAKNCAPFPSTVVVFRPI